MARRLQPLLQDVCGDQRAISVEAYDGSAIVPTLPDHTVTITSPAVLAKIFRDALTPGIPLPISMVMISHMDDDHVAGILNRF